MRITIVPPTIHSKQETGLLGLLSCYLQSAHQVSLVRCNGLFSSCHRDEETNWHRTIESCFSCTAEKTKLSKWASIELEELSVCLSNQDIERTRRWVNSLDANQLEDAKFDACIPSIWCQPIVLSRFGQIFNPENKQHEVFLRRMILMVVRLRLAARRYIFSKKPDIIFLNNEADFISKAFNEAATDFGLAVFTATWKTQRRCIVIEDWNSGRSMDSDLILPSVTDFRNDITSWPVELVDRLEAVLSFAKIPSIRTQLQNSNQAQKRAS